MSADTRDRFLKLERPREGLPGRVDPLPDESRFEHLRSEREAPARRAEPGPAAADRFRAPPARGLETTCLPEGAQPFTRCALCEADNSLYASACASCGAALDTPEQKAFNVRLWAARRAEADAGREPPGDGAATARPAGGEEAAPPGSPLSRFLAAWPEVGWPAVAVGVALGFPALLAAFGHGRVRTAGVVLLLLSLGGLSPLRDRFTRS